MNDFKNLNNDTIILLKKYNLLVPLIKQIILDNCLKDILIDGKTIADLKKNVSKQNKIKDDEEFQLWLAKSNKTETQFFEAITKPLKINKYCMKEFSHKIKSRFLQKKSYFDSVVYSLIRVKDPSLARELYHQISSKESTFEFIAKKYSIGPEQHSRGIVGPTSLESGHPELIELLKVARVGEINEPIRINEVFAITRLEHLNESKLDENMELRMAKDIFEEWLDAEADLVCSGLE